MISRRFNKVLVPVVLLVSVILIVALIITEASDQLDQQSDHLYSAFISSTIQHETEELGQQALDYAWWDEAVQKLVVKPDPEWADANIGSYLYDNFDVSVSLVMNQDNRYTLGFVDGLPQQNLNRFADNPTLEHLISQVRNSPLDDPKNFSGLAHIGGQLYMVGGFPFSPESTDAKLRDGLYLSVLVLLQRMDTVFIQQHAENFELQLGTLDLTHQAPGLILSSPLGQPLATLSYQPPRPGSEFLARITGPLLGLTITFLLIVVLSVLIIVKVSSLNRRIKQEKETLQCARDALQQAHDQMESTVEQRTSALENELEQHKHTEQELLRTEQRFQTLTEEATVAILVHRHSRPLYANPALLALFHFDSFSQVLALDSTLALWSEADQQRVMQYHEARLRGESAPKEYTLSSHPVFGPSRQFANRSFSIDWEGEHAVCTLLLDTTDSLQTQYELQQAKELLEQRVLKRTQELEQANLELANEVSQHHQAQQQLRLNHEVFKSTSEAVLITDSKGTILDVNQAYCQQTGFARDEVLGRNPSIHKSGLHDAQFYHDMWLSLEQNGHWRGEIWDCRKNGDIYPKWLSISEVKGNQEQISHYVGVFSDITERKEQETRLKHLAQYDALTDLPNRRLFKERVEQKLLKAKRHPESKTALLFIDLDHFKHVNDSLGHAAGDQLLVEVAQRIHQCMRSSDTVGGGWDSSNDDQHIVARMGGDEFTIAIEGLPSSEAITVITERLNNALDHPIELDGQKVFVSASIGISVYPDDGTTYEQLVKNADKAMYRSKRSGRNQFNFFSAEMDNVSNCRIELEAGLRTAISEQSFVLHYQPKINTNTGAVSSVEALIRWQHPVKGLVPPGDFIQAAEDTGLIVPIGEWVIATACVQTRVWSQALAIELKVAVNLSARQFRDPLLLEKITQILQHSGLPPQQLELEVTETVMIDDIDSTISTLTALREAGISIAADDFGTGYSSLSYLRKLPLDTLKIDRSFIAKIDQDSKMAAIAEAIIRMGQSLDLDIVAEGVETHAQKQLLRHYGCDCQQGFLFSRPLEADAMEGYLQQAKDQADSIDQQFSDTMI